MEPIKKQLRIFGAHVSLALLLCLVSSLSSAELISLNPSATGSVAQSTLYFGGGGSLPYNFYFVNPLSNLSYYSPGPGTVKASSIAYGYLLFDLSALPFTANAASIEFNLDYSTSFFPDLTVTALPSSEALALSTVPVGSVSFQIPDPGTPEEQAFFLRLIDGFNTLASSPELGKLADSGPLAGTYHIGLNSQALDLINARPALLGVGLVWTPYSDFVPNNPGSDTITFNSAPRLILNSESPLPLPASTWLLGVALLGLFKMQRRKVRGATSLNV